MLPLCKKEGKIRGECVYINMYTQFVFFFFMFFRKRFLLLQLKCKPSLILWYPSGPIGGGHFDCACVVSSYACLSFPHLPSEWTKKQRYSSSTSDTQILFTIISCWKESELSEKCLLKGKIDVMYHWNVLCQKITHSKKMSGDILEGCRSQLEVSYCSI